MKYKVIGWTYGDDYEFPTSQEQIGFAERNAIIDEIKKHKYLFSGWHHQESWENCVPILNDGKKREFSQRGWGGVMAEAYDNFDDYGYSIYTFYQSIDDKYLKFPKNEFDAEDFVSEPILNEHFDVKVNEGLFNIAKKKNPFYLDDLAELRYLDTNDTITLHYQDESLTFLVSDIDRDKKELKFKNSELISTKYKIIVTHKDPNEKIIPKIPLLICRNDAQGLFKECTKKYDFNTLVELFTSYDIDFVINKSKSKKTIETLKRFVNEYKTYSFNERLMCGLLRSIGDLDFYEEVAMGLIKKTSVVMASMLHYCNNNDIDFDNYLLKAIDKKINLKELSLTFLLRALELRPDNQKIRKKAYQASKNTRYNSFLLMFNGMDDTNLSKDDLYYLKLDNVKKIGCFDIMDIVEILSYPNENVVKDEKYRYRLSFLYSYDYKCLKDGVRKYQAYVEQKYGLDNKLEELIIQGCRNRAVDIECEVDAFENNACYIYALDALTKFKYNLKDKMIDELGQKYPALIDALNEQYN